MDKGFVAKHENSSPEERESLTGVYVKDQEVHVTHPNAPYLRGKSLNQIYKIHENEKKSDYNDRILNVEKGTFTPFSSFRVNVIG